MAIIPWLAWHGDTHIQLDFPPGWRVTVASMADAPAAPPDVIRKALHNPIGTPPLRELARERESAVIVVEDITRPLPAAAILPAILSELRAAGIASENIWITIGLGAHTPMNGPDLEKKLGRAVIDSHAVYQNQPYENLAYLGETERGTPIYISRFYWDADLHISLGTITPHPYAGFGGGAKTVAVGMAGIETLEANHARVVVGGSQMYRVEPSENACRADLEEIARAADVHFSINGVVNSQRQLAGLFAGDLVQAHRAGVAFARQVYATALPPPADVVVLNAYPKDTDQVQSANALNAIAWDPKRVLKADGTAVLTAGCHDGAGVHYLESYGMRLYAQTSREATHLGEREMIVYSPNLSYPQVKHVYPPDTLVLRDWEAVEEALSRRHGDRATVTVFPCGAIQIPAGG